MDDSSIFLPFLYFNPSLKDNLNEITYGSELNFILKSLCGGLFKIYNTRREVFFMTARNISSIISMSFYWFSFNLRGYSKNCYMHTNLDKISEFTQISANFEDYWVIFSWSMKLLDINFVHSV